MLHFPSEYLFTMTVLKTKETASQKESLREIYQLASPFKRKGGTESTLS